MVHAYIFGTLLNLRWPNHVLEEQNVNEDPTLETNEWEPDIDLRNGQHKNDDLWSQILEVQSFLLDHDAIPFDVEFKATRRLRGVLGILVHLLSTLLSSCLAGFVEENYDTKGSCHLCKHQVTKDVPSSSEDMEGKKRLTPDYLNLDRTAVDKGNITHDVDSRLPDLKPALDLHDFDDNTKQNKFRGHGTRPFPMKLGGLEYLFTYLRPARGAGHVYPVRRKSSHQGRRPGNQQQRRTSHGQAAEAQWPPETAHDMPWTTFRQELYRVGTFVGLPFNFPVSALRLAQTGFLRLENCAIVCFFCGLRRDTWTAGESPVEVHRQLRPGCPVFIDTANSGNQGVSITAERLAEVTRFWSLSDWSSLPNEIEGRQTTSAGSPQAGPSALPIASSLAQPGRPRPPNPLSTNVSEDASLGTTGGTPPRPGSGATSAAATASGASGQSASEGNHRASAQQPPRLGLLGGAPANASPGPGAASRGPIFDGTAQPDARRAEGRSGPPTTGSELRQTITYQQLGIVTEAPRHPDKALVSSRVATYPDWSSHSHTPQELAEAGFYYAGYSDCSRCFFCAGGLKSWDAADNPWVEHARWFPKCAFVRQCQGLDFIDIVQQLNDASDRQQISLAMVREEINRRLADGDHIQEPVVDAAIASALEMGFSQDSVNSAMHTLETDGNSLTADRLLDYLQVDGAMTTGAGDVHPGSQDDLEREVTELVTENGGMRQQRLCKVCMDNEVSIVMLPCGHLACCAECSPALRTCPVCRQVVKGRVRAFPV